MIDVLIFGCGYLGRRVARRYLDQGRRVAAVTRGRAAELRQLGVEPVVADVLDPATLTALPSADVIVYAVGFDRQAGVPMRAVYVDGLANVLTALPPAGRFVYVSSTSVYGQADGEAVDESAATESADESGRVVLAAEQLLRRSRPDAVVLRFAGIYGPGRLLRESAIRAGELIACDPETWLNLIQADDGAAAVLAAADRGRPGATYNVADDEPVRRRDFYARLAAVLGAPPPTFAPGPAGANRRVVNRAMRRDLGVALRYPTYRDGLAAAR